MEFGLPMAMPARKSVELFNDVARIRFGDVEQAVRLVFALKGLLRRERHDAIGWAALARASALMGDRDQAVEAANRACTLPGLDRTLLEAGLSGILCNLGLADTACRLWEHEFSGTIQVSEAVDPAAFWPFLLSGRLWMLADLSGSRIMLDNNVLIPTLHQLHLFEHWPAIQGRIRTILFPHLLNVEFVTQAHDDGAPFLSCRYYLDGKTVDRGVMAERIWDALESLERDHPGLQGWDDRLFITVLVAPSQSDLQGCSGRGAAA